MAKGLIRRYIWLIDTIRSANGITYEEINRKWNRSALNDDGKGKTLIKDILEFEPYGLTYALEWFAIGRVVQDANLFFIH